MRALLDTAPVPAADRAESIRELIWSSVVRVDITHHPEPERIFAHGSIADVGPINVCSVRSNATTIRRTHRLASGDDREPSVFVGLQMAGTSIVVQRGREAVLRPGDLAVYSTTEPYTLLNDDGIHQHFFRMRERDLGLPGSLVHAATAVRFSGQDPVGALAASHLGRLVGLPPVDEDAAASVATAGIELVRAAILHHVGRPDPPGERPHDAAVAPILEFIRSHLGDPDLSPRRIAHATHMSVRQLYVVLARADISLGEWVRQRRLEECRRDLLHADPQATTIASIARRWGFIDPTHFSRAFKAAYGVTPREWRDQHTHRRARRSSEDQAC